MSLAPELIVLVVDDEPLVRSALARLPLEPGMQMVQAGSADEARAAFSRHTIDVALIDQHLGAGQPAGLDLLGELTARDGDCFRIICTGAADLAFAVEAINGGRIDAFLTKPWSVEHATALMLQGAETCLLRRHNRALVHELSQRNTDLLDATTNLERLVTERTANLREANERLVQQQRTLVRLETQGVVTHLAKGLAHELNNPLAVILGYAQRLRRAPAILADSALVERLTTIQQEVERCRNLVGQLHRLASPLDEECSSLDPAQVLHEAVEGRRQAGQLCPQVTINGHPPRVLAATTALHRVFAEILANAVIAGAQHVTLSGSSEHDRVTVRLANDGVVPGADETANATKPFYTSRSADGARGLGLAVCLGLLQDQDGHLELRASEPAEHPGAVVVIRLPASAAPTPLAASALHCPSTLQGTVLVVDDDILIAELLGDIITEVGLEVCLVHTCAEARAALATARARGHSITAVVCDQHLPDGLGIDLLRELRQQPDGTLQGRLALISGDHQDYGDIPTLHKPFRLEQVALLLAALSDVSKTPTGPG